MSRPRPLGALLAAAALALVLSACSAGTPNDPVAQATDAPAVAAPTPTAAPAPEPEPTVIDVDPTAYAAQELGSGVVFVSPSRNLRCGVVHWDGPATWGCSIIEKEWEFPRESPDDFCYDAQVSCGWGIEATGDEMPHPRKRGDVAFESEYRTDSPVLGYGTSVSYSGITCVSEERGITCEDIRTGHGFTISKSLNEIW